MSCTANPDIIQVPWEWIEGDDAPKVQKFGSDDGENATFRIKGEDHTLGNALRWMLATSNRKSVELAAYTIPHPHSDAMNLRIQTRNHHEATDVLIENCKKLQSLCDVVDSKYREALLKYNKEHPKESNVKSEEKKESKKKKGSKKEKKESKKKKVAIEQEMDSDDDDDILM